jgi:hypothetical protein
MPHDLSIFDVGPDVPDAPRHTFEVYVDDTRYSVPTLYLIAADEAGAVEAARRMVVDSPHHLGAELRLDGQRLIGFGSLAVGEDLAE